MGSEVGKGRARMASINMDTVVIGGGITGAAIVYALARRGVRHLLLLEQRFPTPSGPNGFFGVARTYYDNSVMVTLARRSLRLYEHFADEIGGTADFVRTGMLVLVPEGEQEELEANVGVARHLGSRLQLLPTSDDVRTIEPRISLAGVAAAAYEADAGYGDPVKAAAAFANRAREMGVQIRQGIRVLRIDTAGEDGDRRITGLLTDGGYVSTNCIVNAGGVLGQAINQMVGVELPVSSYRYLGLILRHPSPFGPPHPITLDLANGIALRPSGRNLTLVGPIGAVAEDQVPPGWDDPRSDPAATPEFQKLVRRRYPTLATATVHAAWATSHDVTPDWRPMIGPVEGVDGLYCALGMGGNLFALAPAVGELVARLVTGEGTDGIVRPKRLRDLNPRSHAYFFRSNRFNGRE
jgi:sarcosine oxidase subunit beta